MRILISILLAFMITTTCIAQELEASFDSFSTSCTNEQYVFVNDSERVTVGDSQTFKDYECITKTDHEALKTALYNQITDETKGFDVDINNREILSETLNKETQALGKNSIDIKALAALGKLPPFKQIVRNYFISILKP